MILEPPEPGGYTMGHPFNQIVFSQFPNLDFKDEWVRTGYNHGVGAPPEKYAFSRDPNDGMREDDLYGILNVEPTCSSIELKKAYAAQSKKWHPDKCDPAVGEAAALRTRWIIAAFKILSDVEARAFWDRRIARVAKERRSAELIAPKRRPRIRGSAAAVPAATDSPLQREAARLTVLNARTEQAGRAVTIFIGESDTSRGELLVSDLDGAMAFLLSTSAATIGDFLKEIKQFCKDKINDRVAREFLREKDGLTVNWLDLSLIHI